MLDCMSEGDYRIDLGTAFSIEVQGSVAMRLGEKM